MGELMDIHLAGLSVSFVDRWKREAARRNVSPRQLLVELVDEAAHNEPVAGPQMSAGRPETVTFLRPNAVR